MLKASWLALCFIPAGWGMQVQKAQEAAEQGIMILRIPVISDALSIMCMAIPI